MGQTLRKAVWLGLKMLNMHLHNDPMIPLLGIYSPKRNEFMRPHKDSYTSAHGSSSHRHLGSLGR